MVATDVTISLDAELKDKTQPIFDALGIDISTAINMLLRKMVFQVATTTDSVADVENDDDIYLVKPNPYKTPLFGCMKDSIEISPNFDEPPEEMKEYMF